jgi:putative spermidine/putrescine transport system substrate-binding protein
MLGSKAAATAAALKNQQGGDVMKQRLFALVALAVFALSAHAQPKELVVAAYGGAYTDALRKNIATFEAANNVKVRFIPASGADGIGKAKAREVDVIHADLAWASRGEAQGLFEKLDPALVPNLAAVFPRARISEYGVATNFGQYGIAYNPAAVPTAPTSWNDLLRPEFKGRVTTAGFDDANVELMVLFAKLNGGSEDQIDTGFKKMAELGSNVTVFYNQHPQLLELFRANEVVMARWLRGRVDWARQKGVELKFVVPKEGAIALVSTVHVVKGRPNTELAMKFVNHLLGKASQLQYPKDLGYTPARADLDPKDIPDTVPYSAEMVNALQMADWKKITPKLDAWRARWSKEVSR